MIQVPRLEVKQLYDQRKRRDHARLRSYNTLLEQIYHRVYSSSQLPGTTASILYSVPPFILGLPKMDMEDCIVYIVFQLRTSGFEVKFTWPNLLYISWAHHEASYLESQNPIVQAMLREAKSAPTPAPAPTLPLPKAAPKKKQLPSVPTAQPVSFTTKFNTEIDIITATQPYTSFGSPPKRETSEYVPPDSFIQTMERPVKTLPSFQPMHDAQSLQRAQAQLKPQNPKSVLDDLWG